jgi:hypothetical protein
VADHTPTPWHTGSTNHTELVMGFRDNIECVISESDPELDMPMDEAAANAAFIVKAVNSHDALVKALRKALNYIENTENELGIQLTCGDEARAALKEIDRG